MSEPLREVLIGVDGSGGTTQAVVTDLSGRLLGRGLGPSSNHHTVGLANATAALGTAIEGALVQVVDPGRAGAGPTWKAVKVAAVCLGLSGIDTPEDKELYLKWITQQGMSPKPSVVNDSELILSGGTPEGWGVGVISASGSICVGRARDGRTARVGGWGHVFGDEGSGYHIGVEALRLASQTADGRAGASGLLKAILAHWKLAIPEGLIGRVYRTQITIEQISELAVVVQELASRGDPDASALVERAATELALHVDTVVRKLGFKEPPVALGGATLRASLKRGLLKKITVPLGPVNLVQDPAQAAIVIAKRTL